MRPADPGLNTPDDFQSNHQSLVAIPLKYQRTPPGTSVIIPSPFLGLEAVTSEDGGLSSVYDNRTRRWGEGLRASTTLLRVKIPDSVKPLQLTEARLQFKLLAPTRSVRLSTGSRDQLATASTMEEPAGTYELTLTEPEQLRVDDEGDYFLEIDVQNSSLTETGAGSNQAWNIDYVRLELQGRTFDSGESSPVSKEAANQ